MMNAMRGGISYSTPIKFGADLVQRKLMELEHLELGCVCR